MHSAEFFPSFLTRSGHPSPPCNAPATALVQVDRIKERKAHEQRFDAAMERHRQRIYVSASSA